MSETFAKTKREACEQNGRMAVIKRINKRYIQMQRLVSNGVCCVVCKDSNIPYSILLVCLNIVCSVVHRLKHFLNHIYNEYGNF